jgi:hypothetical protein
MSDSSESNAVLGFVVGAIVIAALAFVFFVVPGQNGSSGSKATPDLNVTIEAPPTAAPAPAPANPG